MTDYSLPPGATVWAYFRDSGGEEQERSVGQQLDVAREYAARHGLHLTLTFTDAARKGSCIIRAMPTTDSGGCRPLVPKRVDQQFRRMASTFSWSPESVVAMFRN